MPLTKIGINLTGLDNISTPTFNIKEDGASFLADIPVKANEITFGYYGLTVLIGLFVFLWYKMQQNVASGGGFDYDQWRSVGLASCICSILGIFSLNIGIFVNFYHVVIFVVIAFISTGVVWKNQT